jgi:Tat protein translocase TatB subunit
MLSKIGTGELIVIILVALFVVGPERLPKFAKSFGKAIANFKHYMNDFTKELSESNADIKEVSDELRKAKEDLSDTLKDARGALEKTSANTEKDVLKTQTRTRADAEVASMDTSSIIDDNKNSA